MEQVRELTRKANALRREMVATEKRDPSDRKTWYALYSEWQNVRHELRIAKREVQ